MANIALVTDIHFWSQRRFQINDIKSGKIL